MDAQDPVAFPGGAQSSEEIGLAPFPPSGSLDALNVGVHCKLMVSGHSRPRRKGHSLARVCPGLLRNSYSWRSDQSK